jgi:hypothetical protein
MADYRYFGAKATLVVTRPGGGTVTLAAIKEWTITPRFDHVEDYDNESVFLGDVARIKGRVEVKIKVGKWNPVVAESWMMDILKAGVVATPAGQTSDTNAVGRFTITGTVKPFGQTVNFRAVVSGVYFEAFPVVGAQDVWNPMELSGVGTSAVFSNPA